MSTKTYSELMSFETFEERYRYLRINGEVGAETFGCDRYLNQLFYSSDEWKRFRRNIIIRDMGCDLGIEDRDIVGLIIVHHINPITIDDVLQRRKCLMDPDNVICVSFNTHQAIHYGDDSLLIQGPIERKMNDTCPWKH